MQHTTLCFLTTNTEVLLAMKKRGFGAGRWNGTGGKLLPDETPLQATIRETQEEIGVTPVTIEKRAELTFTFPDGKQQFCEVFVATHWQDEPVETEEMRPQWFLIDNLPFSEMWSDDILWLPQILKNDFLKASFTFDENDEVAASEVTPLSRDTLPAQW